MRVAVGSGDGQAQGFWMVVWNVQSESGQVLWQLRFWIVRVAVGQEAEEVTASGASAAVRWLVRVRSAVRARSFILVGGEGLLSCL
jgi:archaeosine-15-forming tRNA-guanine transglycosylase